MRKESLLLKIWNTTWPLVIYSAAQMIVSALGMLVLFLVYENPGEELYYQYGVLYLLIAALICVPIYLRMYRRDGIKNNRRKNPIPMELKDYFAIIITGAALAVAMNNIISITPLPQMFTGYEETNEILFSGGLLLQILSAGIFGCIVEEISLRGVIYLRMKRYWGKRKAMILSALVFGIYHMNVVQAVYAFFLGLFFAWIFERYDTLWAPIIAHMSANLFVLMLGSSDFINRSLQTMVGYCLITCISILVFWHGCRFMKQTDPMVELEFVEKDPDTLKGLSEEYKEQEREDD